MCVVSSKVVRKGMKPAKPRVVGLNVYSQKNNAGYYVIHVSGDWQGKRYVGYGQVKETTCNTSKALGDWLMRAMPAQLHGLCDYVSDVKVGNQYHTTPFEEVLYGLVYNMNTGKVVIHERIGMPAIKAILSKMGWAAEVQSNQHIINKIVLTEIV